ncbi:YqhA family protein [Pseudoprimorskyibacter insulae]|uniref:YqhA family protein n=1 Tax=Pseudoprimorskyibacter insulae TaxID=1695997 RepID=A0A2R8ATW8_9RHOB|nr:YqhA family protein [Pseudoprimorskyibacter insulae]SPF79420.1 hypothetical protein PRI8871_01216 [Pseudoprimorskyibacter insulae]
MNKVLGLSRYLILIAVAGAFVAATLLLVYGFAQAVHLVQATLAEDYVSRKTAKAIALESIEIIDMFLMGTVFYIVALGLYELFIDSRVKLPAWLAIKTLDDLKTKLISVVIVVLAVLFLGNVVSWDGQSDVMGLGVGIGAVIAALAWFMGAKPGKPAPKDKQD